MNGEWQKEKGDSARKTEDTQSIGWRKMAGKGGGDRAVVVATVVVARWLWIGWGATGTPVLNVKVREAVCVGAYTRVIDRVERSLARSFLAAASGCLPTGSRHRRS